MLELYQAEWCPSSRRVRQRLTELGIDYVVRQVPVEREVRVAMWDATGTRGIPVLRGENGAVIAGGENILAFLAEHFEESPEAESHRRKAETMLQTFLDDECECAGPQSQRDSFSA
jgi:glutathione S-transferase